MTGVCPLIFALAVVKIRKEFCHKKIAVADCS